MNTDGSNLDIGELSIDNLVDLDVGELGSHPRIIYTKIDNL